MNKEIPKFVCDASIILKWFLSEMDGNKQANAIGKDFIAKRNLLLIPDYAYAEILNVLAIKQGHDKTLFDFSKLLGMNLLECQISIEIASLAIKFMEQIPKTTFYDTCYHALAKMQHATFVTADKKYYDQAKNLGDIILLKNYGLSLN